MLTDDVADVAVALIMMTGRGFVRLNRFVHAGEWLKRGPELTTKLGGKTVGILGLGRIGKAIAQRVSRDGHEGRLHRPQAAGRAVSNTSRDLKALAAAVDFLVVACPGGAATKNIVNADVLAALGKKGTLVNIARGSIVDEPALVAALKAGTIKAAGLDVFADEPQHPAATDDDGQRRAAAARRQRDARDAPGDGRPVQGEPRRLVRRQAGADADSRARLGIRRTQRLPAARPNEFGPTSISCRRSSL